MILGIDATNLRLGGGVTHIVELLNALDITKYNISKVIIWGGKDLLGRIENFSWIQKINPKELDKSLFIRTYWQLFKLSREVKSNNCNLLFVPGGSFIGKFKPYIVMNQN